MLTLAMTLLNRERSLEGLSERLTNYMEIGMIIIDDVFTVTTDEDRERVKKWYTKTLLPIGANRDAAKRILRSAGVERVPPKK